MLIAHRCLPELYFARRKSDSEQIALNKLIQTEEHHARHKSHKGLGLRVQPIPLDR